MDIFLDWLLKFITHKCKCGLFKVNRWILVNKIEHPILVCPKCDKEIVDSPSHVHKVD